MDQDDADTFCITERLFIFKALSRTLATNPNPLNQEAPNPKPLMVVVVIIVP